MSRAYDQFKNETFRAENTIKEAERMRAVDEEFARGFAKAMWEAREIFMRLEDEAELNSKEGRDGR